MNALRFALAYALALATSATTAAEFSSEYTKLDTAADCTVFAAAAEGDGEWANLTCNGFRGYPVLVYAADARESWHYGFPPRGDLAPLWESFAGFNAAGTTIEWRLADKGNGPVPFATIHRWTVSGPDGNSQTQVLVVEKVADLGGDGCVVGYVVATGNGKANQQARDVADQYARNFACGADRPEIREGNTPLPALSVAEQ